MTRKERNVTVFVATLIQIVPTAVIVATDSVPAWCRWTLAAWLGLWATVTIARGSAATQ